MSSKRKKAAKLKRVMAAVKKQQRKTKRNHENFAAIQLLHDPQVHSPCSSEATPCGCFCLLSFFMTAARTVNHLFSLLSS